MNNAFSVFTLIVTLLTGATVGADELGCPARVSVSQQIGKVPSPWVASYAKAPLTLGGVTFYDGHPSEMASLVYDDEKTSGNTIVATWFFRADTSARGFWLSCRYNQTTAVLSRQIPRNITECSVTYNSKETVSGHYVIKAIKCK